MKKLIIILLVFIIQPSIAQQNPLEKLKKLTLFGNEGIPLNKFHLKSVSEIKFATGIYETLRQSHAGPNYVSIDLKNNKVQILHSYGDGNDYHSENLKFISLKNGIITTDKALIYLVYTDKVKTLINNPRIYNGIILRFTNSTWPLCKYDRNGLLHSGDNRRSFCHFFFKGDYLNRSLSGEWNDYYDNGNLRISESYENDQLVGEWREYFENGQLKSIGYYKNGVQDREWKEYFENGNLSKVSYYSTGKQEGERKEYYNNSQLKSIFKFKNDKLDGICKAYYENGALFSEISFINGIKHGQWKGYYNSGSLKFISNFNEGDGVSNEYYQNGKLKSVKNFKNDVPFGEFLEYDQSGKLIVRKIYNNDNKDPGAAGSQDDYEAFIAIFGPP